MYSLVRIRDVHWSGIRKGALAAGLAAVTPRETAIGRYVDVDKTVVVVVVDALVLLTTGGDE